MPKRLPIHRLPAIAAGFAVMFGAFAGAAPATSKAPPQNTSRPTITGSAQVGSTLTAHNGGWTGTKPIRFGFQWLRCDSNGARCSDMRGADNQRYVVRS